VSGVLLGILNFKQIDIRNINNAKPVIEDSRTLNTKKKEDYSIRGKNIECTVTKH